MPEASLVRVVLLPREERAVAFQFDADGCQTVTLDLDVVSMEAVFATARVAAPFVRA